MPVNAVVKINAIDVPPDAGPELEKRFANRAHAVDGQPGFLGFQLLRPIKGASDIVLRTLFGAMTIPTQRLYHCRCDGAKQSSFSPAGRRPIFRTVDTRAGLPPDQVGIAHVLWSDMQSARRYSAA